MKRRDKSANHGWLFITGAAYRRVPLFWKPEYCEIFLENLSFYRRKYHFDVLGYVLLPDHNHLLLAVPEEVPLQDLLRDFKSQVGRQVVDTLRRNGEKDLLQRLAVKKVRRRKDARFRVLQGDNYIRRIFSEKFFRQKLEYIHLNPVREGLADSLVDYLYSSARWYEGAEEERTQWQGPLG